MNASLTRTADGARREVLKELDPRVRLAIALGAAGVVAFTVLGLAAVSRAIEDVRDAGIAVRYSRQRLDALHGLLAVLQDAESGERGYLLSGDAGFLEPYRSAVTALEPALARLVVPDPPPGWNDELPRLRAEARAQLVAMRATIERRALEGPASRLAEAERDAGKRRMDSLRALIAGMRLEVERRVESRYAAYEASLDRGRRAALGWLGAAASLSLLTIAFVVHHALRRRSAEAEAERAFTLLRETLDDLNEGVLVLDREHRVEAWNRRFTDLRGVAPATLARGTPLTELVRLGRPLQVRGDAGAVAGVLPDVQNRREFFLEMLREDGTELEVRGTPMPDGHYVVTYTDVTQLRRSERTARNRASRLDAIMDNIVDGIVTINESGSIESFSAGAERMLGWRAPEVLRRNVAILMPGGPAAQHDDFIAAYRRTGVRRVIGGRRELEARRRDGTTLPVELTISELWLDENRLFIGVMRDITERRRMERLQNEFISTVSHELRTPLTSIVGALGLLRGGVGGELGAQSRRLIEVAHENGHRLVRLVNDFLDLEKMEAGKLEFRLAPHALRTLVAQSVEANRAYADGYGVTLETVLPAGELKANVDPQRLQQVIANLVSNAVKFSPRGAVVTVGLARDGGTATLYVADRGPGIPPEFRARVFDKFAQADASDARGRSGTGLGLSIVKSIAEHLGGSVDFDTEIGRGTTFRVRLPLWRGGEELLRRPGEAETAPAGGAHVLVVEDDPDIVLVLQELLRVAGYAHTSVSTGADALAALGGRAFDAILLDLHLPDRNGRTLVREFRSRLAPQRVPILILSATFGPNELRDAEMLGVEACLEKPVDGPKLLECLRLHVTAARAEA